MEKYEVWLERAESSYKLSKANYIWNVCYEDLCFQAQQAAEKALKGLLIYYGVEPEFTHSIGKLLSELDKYTEVSEEIKNTIDLTNYAVQTRYPGGYDEITRKDYKEAVKLAKTSIDWVKNVINKNEKQKTEAKK